ncbi:hypothetical protein RHSIM_Rhsim01G0011400 [Rhododendron simsii]|uniref:F-box domain-containing protein n=1 Tax=Rhododendron simsii TaxID=118357 RepID=A0A834M0V7_RHOSS|nr:hypothetical protein RHSIM_Rhsim01G0011400 [Rhododendron simsii]
MSSPPRDNNGDTATVNEAADLLLSDFTSSRYPCTSRPQTTATRWRRHYCERRCGRDDIDREIENLKELEKELNRDWASLPTDLLCLMLPHLFLGDIKRFHNVCRSWQLTTTPLVQSPMLMSIGNYNTRCKFFHPLFKSPYSMYILELFCAVPRFCKDGWLLMFRGEHSMFFNPFTKALINLPDLRERVSKLTKKKICATDFRGKIEIFSMGVSDRAPRLLGFVPAKTCSDQFDKIFVGYLKTYGSAPSSGAAGAGGAGAAGTGGAGAAGAGGARAAASGGAGAGAATSGGGFAGYQNITKLVITRAAEGGGGSRLERRRWLPAVVDGGGAERWRRDGGSTGEVEAEGGSYGGAEVVYGGGVMATGPEEEEAGGGCWTGGGWPPLSVTDRRGWGMGKPGKCVVCI